MPDKSHTADIGKNEIHGYFIARIELDGAGQPVDWTFLHPNEELARIEGKTPEQLNGHRFLEIFPNGDRKWLDLFYKAAYQGQSVCLDDISGEAGIYLHVEAYPTGRQGYCGCVVCDIQNSIFAKLRQQEEAEALLQAYETEKQRNIRIRGYAQAIGIVYPLVISIDYTNDSYSMLEYDNFLNKTAAESGTVEDLVSVGASTIPDPKVAAEFEALFKKEAAIAAFRSGKKELCLRHPQNGDDGLVHYMETHIICTECSDAKITAICMAKCIDEEAEREQAMQQAADHAAVINALATIYTTIIEGNLVNHNYKIIQTNSSIMTVPGVKNQGNFDEVMDAVLRFFVHPDSMAMMREFADLSTLADRMGENTSLMTEYLSPWGNWFESRFIAKERNAAGRVQSVIYAVRKITAEKLQQLHFQKQIREQLAIFDALARNFKNVYLVDLQAATAKVLKLEDEYADHRLDDVINTEFLYEPFLNAWIADAVHVDDQAAVRQALSIANLREIFPTREEYTGTYRMQMNGKMMHYQFTVLLTEDRAHLIAGFQNVDSIIQTHLAEENKRRQLEQAYQTRLREQLMISNTLARNFKNVYLIDLEKETAKPLKLEGCYAKMLKDNLGQEIPFDSLLQQWMYEVVHPEDRNEVSRVFTLENVRRLFSVQDAFTGNYRSIADGQVHYFQYNMSKADESGAKAILGFQPIDDIIRKQVEEEKRRRDIEQTYQQQLKAAAEAADRANKAKTEFLLRMSHDIRTPLNGIRGMLDIADHYGSDLEKVRECRRKVRESSNILLELINEVLDMSKLESGEVTLEHIPFDLGNISSEVFTVVEKMAEEQAIEIIEDCNVPHTRFVGSPVHYKRLLLNILGNAIKYNRPHGKVRVICREASFDGKIAMLETVVKDTGIGMSEEFQQHLFEPFRQEDSSARTKYGGTGLGLSIAKSLSEKLGGTIACESTKDVGTTFTIRIPFEVDSSEYTEEGKDEAEIASITGETVLLAEDNEINLEIAQFVLSEAGARVIPAHDGKEAAAAFAASKPGEISAILMDLMMPVMDGYEATRRIRAMDRPDAQTIPIIAMTANAFVEDRIATKKAGMNAHIAKPLNAEKVIRIISEQIKAAQNRE